MSSYSQIQNQCKAPITSKCLKSATSAKHLQKAKVVDLPVGLGSPLSLCQNSLA